MYLYLYYILLFFMTVFHGNYFILILFLNFMNDILILIFSCDFVKYSKIFKRGF